MLHVVQEILLTKTFLNKMKINRKNKNSSINEYADSMYISRNKNFNAKCKKIWKKKGKSVNP